MEGIRNSLISNEIDSIINSGAKDVHFTFGAELYVGTEKVAIHRVNSININGDYGGAYQDEIMVSFKFEPSVYQTKIYPNFKDIMVHLTRTPVHEDGKTATGPQIALQKLRAYLVTPTDMVGDKQFELTSDGLDLMGFVDVDFQLVDPFANRIRLFMCGTNYRSMSPAETLCATIARAVKGTVIDGRAIAPKITMVAPDNTRKRAVIAIPHGKSLIDLPHYLQDREGGIYNAGIRMYIHRGGFFVWPKYYLGDQVGQGKMLTIYNLPANQLPGAERTYRETDYQVIMISTGKNVKFDSTQGIELNEGNGIRFTDARAVLDGMVVTEGNRSYVRRGFANSEFIDGETGRDENYAPVGGRRVTDNACAEVSRLAARKGTVNQFVWDNADPYILEPGMATRIISLEDGKTVERMGSLIGANYHMGPKVNNIKNNQLTITAGLSIFVGKTAKVSG